MYELPGADEKCTCSPVEVERIVRHCPRLEFKWIRTGDDWSKRECIYYLVLPFGEFDIRREDQDGNKIHDENYIELGRTAVNGGRKTRPVWEDGTVETPFRDGAHAMWDSKALGNIPVYAVCGETITLLENRAV